MTKTRMQATQAGISQASAFRLWVAEIALCMMSDITKKNAICPPIFFRTEQC